MLRSSPRSPAKLWRTLGCLMAFVVSCGGNASSTDDDEPRERDRFRIGGQGDDSTDDGSTEEVACNVPALFARSCSGSICHGGQDATPPSGVELVNTDFAEDLVDVPAVAYRDAVHNPQDCPSQPELFINSQSLSDSLMWTKLTNTHACGDAMPIPYSIAHLSTEELDCVYQWMEELVQEKYPN